MGGVAKVKGPGHARRTGRSKWLMRLLRAAGLIIAIGGSSSCESPIDTTRKVGVPGSLGDDMYSALCDRLGASSFTEDLSGESYQAICHFDSQGNYGDFVNVDVLPPVRTDAAVLARQASIAKLQRMAQRRAELIAAFNTIFPDIEIPNATTPDPNDTVRFHDALLDFSHQQTRLYEENPADPSAPPIMPMVTQSLGRLVGALENSPEARAALGRIAGRLGYRPFQVGLGAIRVGLGYPKLRPLARAALMSTFSKVSPPVFSFSL